MNAIEAGPEASSAGAGAAKSAHTSLAAVFCRLARERFTGVVYAECARGGGVFSFRDGRAVFFEDVRDGHSVADSLLAQGLITKLQYADIGAEVLNAVVESEDVAFCQQAVRFGVLTRTRVDQELDRRVRHHLVQAIGWVDCRVEVDPDPESVVGILDYPQELGPLVYMGVRTFFDEDRLATFVPNQDRRFVRWLGGERDATLFFGLDVRESGLLSRLSGDTKVGAIIDEAGPDELELRQLVAVLQMAGLIELTEVRASDRVRSDRRGIERAADERAEPSTGRYAAPFVREERLGAQRAARPAKPAPMAETAAARGKGSKLSKPAPAKPAAPVLRQRDHALASSPRPQGSANAGGPIHPLLRDPAPAPLPPRSVPRPPSHPVSTSQPVRPAPGGAKLAQPEPVDSVVRPSPRPVSVSERPSREWRPKRIGATLKRLDEELKHLRVAAPAPAAVAPPVATSLGLPGRANLDQLIRMRQAAIDQRKTEADEQAAHSAGAVESFRAAQDALRKQKFARAHELMGKACAAAPGNATYTLYHQWAAFRANMLSEEDVNKLRASLREKVSDDQLKPFAYYALGHIALVDKKEDTAERCFSKAIELDKENKDAVRHLRILELRRKAAAEGDKGNKFFGIDVGRKTQ